MTTRITTVKELIDMDIDIDVYDNVCEDICVAFCGPCRLTEEGKRVFADLMEWNVEIVTNNCGSYAIVDVDGPEGVWQKKLKLAKFFFNGLAGFISDERWHELFEEV